MFDEFGRYVGDALSAMRNWGSPAQQTVPAGSYSPVSPEVLQGNADPLGLLEDRWGQAAASGLPGATDGAWQPSFWDRMTGYRDPTNNMQVGGWGSLALGAAQGIGGALMGMQQMRLAQDALKEQKRQFNQNFAAQRTLTNGRLEDRQRARVASNPGAYESVGSYMQRNGVR